MIKWRGGQEKRGQGKGGEGREGKEGEGRGGKGWDGGELPRKQILATALNVLCVDCHLKKFVFYGCCGIQQGKAASRTTRAIRRNHAVKR
jgi:hypothetical protein